MPSHGILIDWGSTLATHSDVSITQTVLDPDLMCCSSTVETETPTTNNSAKLLVTPVVTMPNWAAPSRSQNRRAR